ncbi:unnamed protein product [Miscanthus lutarioriparius]|uniref:Protein kinase domain-containing protein n=1 Tax=Miscanthus lutarioriparius TaxID=422564 RepID=A0A811N6E8_9POAL|nr:unnamed protein product [Miscanthus lutarioriparius]
MSCRSAVDLMTGAIGHLLTKLGEFLKQEHNLRTSMKGDIESLETQLRRMDDALSEMTPRAQQEYDKYCAYELRDLSYDVEDIVNNLLLTMNDGSEPMTNNQDSFRDTWEDIKARVKNLDAWRAGIVAKPTTRSVDPSLEDSAFVSVGRQADVKKALRDILIDLGKKRYSDLNMTMLNEGELIDELQHFLENKRFLIVIDGIRGIPSWEVIKCALVDNGCGSRLVTTSRVLDAAELSGEDLELMPLSIDGSKELFYATLCGRKGALSFDPLDEQTTEYILQKCGCVPLAIIMIASLLAGKPQEEWTEVYNSIGFGQEDNMGAENNTRKIVQFSYYDLPSHLKTCLLYLSIFPDDHVIEKDTLVWRWVAEGFVHDDGELEESLFKVGERGLKIEIGHLRYLQTLDLTDTDISALPCGVTQLRQLKCLRCFALRGLKSPKGIGNLTSLEELWLGKVHNSPNFTKELSKLTELRVLHIVTRYSLGGKQQEAALLVQSLSKLQKIEGVLNGKEVAVKLLHSMSQKLNYEEDFMKEFENLRRLDHTNIVQLLGYCYEIKRICVEYEGKYVLADNIDRALCFDYMPNGSLQGHLNGIIQWIDVHWSLLQMEGDGLGETRERKSLNLPSEALLQSADMKRSGPDGLSTSELFFLTTILAGG